MTAAMMVLNVTIAFIAAFVGISIGNAFIDRESRRFFFRLAVIGGLIGIGLVLVQLALSLETPIPNTAAAQSTQEPAGCTCSLVEQ